MSITVDTVLKRVRLGVNDVGGKWLTDAQYNSFIFAPCAVVQESSAHTFNLRDSGIWSLDGGEWAGNPYVLNIPSSSPFTELSTSSTYEASCWGNIVTAAVDTTASYSITASVIDYAYVMSELYFWLANHRSLEIASANGQMVGDTARYLIDRARDWQGISQGGSLWSAR